MFTIEGETLAQALAIPIHLSGSSRWCGTCWNRADLGNAGGRRLCDERSLSRRDPRPDIAIMMPVFFRGPADRDIHR